MQTASADDETTKAALIAQNEAHRAEKVYRATKLEYEAKPNDLEAAWQFGRACFDLGDSATSNKQREEIANEGIAACQQAVQSDPNSAAAHYYLFMNFAQLARTKTLGALKILHQMETELERAIELDPTFDYAGPDRNLGMLYLQTPGWPISIGSNSKARQHFQRALKLSPDYPDNVLNMIEAELKWGDKTAALRDLKTLDEIWPKQQAKLTGVDWASSWADWEKRREVARKKSNEKPKPVASPHHLEN